LCTIQIGCLSKTMAKHLTQLLWHQWLLFDMKHFYLKVKKRCLNLRAEVDEYESKSPNVQMSQSCMSSWNTLLVSFRSNTYTLDSQGAYKKLSIDSHYVTIAKKNAECLENWFLNKKIQYGNTKILVPQFLPQCNKRVHSFLLDTFTLV
jgi:hypothetical protein